MLPRRHPNVRGEQHAGYRVSAPAGAYARVPAWRSREHWIGVIVPLAIAARPEVLKRHGVQAATLRMWARVKAGYANRRTGRHVIVRPDVLATVLALTARQVKRLNACARELGLEVVVMRGRMLTWEERQQARLTGSHQRGLSTEVGLTVPTWLTAPVDHVTPPRRGVPKRTTHLETVSPRGCAAQTEAATRPRPGRKGLDPASARLAADLIRVLPWLHGERVGRLVPALRPFCTASTPWTAHDVTTALAGRALRRGRPATVRPERIRTRPAALLAAMLRELDPETDHPAIYDQPWTTPQPCGAPECDGHGWINTTRPDGLIETRRCPSCPDAVRAAANRPAPGSSANDDDEPLF